jgi:hypothetical protein
MYCTQIKINTYTRIVKSRVLHSSSGTHNTFEMYYEEHTEPDTLNWPKTGLKLSMSPMYSKPFRAAVQGT